MSGSSSSTKALTDRLAAAVREQAKAAGAETTAVRRSDWRLATVQTIGSDGTITTTDGVVARRVATYVSPTVAQVIEISEAGSGNWLARGPLGTGTGGWTTLPLAGTFAATAGYYVPAYRLNGDGTASLCGLASMSGTLAAGATVANLPVEARPANRARCTVQVAVGFFGVMTLNPDGTITLGDFSAALPGTGTKYAQFDCFGRYRLA